MDYEVQIPTLKLISWLNNKQHYTTGLHHAQLKNSESQLKHSNQKYRYTDHNLDVQEKLDDMKL